MRFDGMGESRRKSRKGAAIVAAEPRCIYCASPSETVEHMPPRSMFRDKDRPSAMEFGACTACNGATRGADVVASVIARLHPDIPKASWQNAAFANSSPRSTPSPRASGKR